MIIARIISLAIGYLFGMFSTGYFVGKLYNTDIRNHGSGNAGSTNALRTVGIKGGLMTLTGDVLKCVLAVIITFLIFHNIYNDGVRLLMMYAGLGTVLGHDFPFYLGFRGGKGIACTLGFIISYDIRMAPLLMVVFLGVVFFTRYVSLGSLIGIGLFFVEVLIFGNMGYIDVAPCYLNESYLLAAIIMIIAYVRHKDNIKRLINGNENKISFKKAGKEE